MIHFNLLFIMALTQAVTLQNNFSEDSTFPNAYFRIDWLEGSKHFITIKVGTYKTNELFKIAENNFSFVPTLNDNFIKQGYEYLKTLPEFADAIDC